MAVLSSTVRRGFVWQRKRSSAKDALTALVLPFSSCHAWAGGRERRGGGHPAASLHRAQPSPSHSLLLPWLTVMLDAPCCCQRAETFLWGKWRRGGGEKKGRKITKAKFTFCVKKFFYSHTCKLQLHPALFQRTQTETTGICVTPNSWWGMVKGSSRGKERKRRVLILDTDPLWMSRYGQKHRIIGS